jgi:ABC-type antimicrobial peptide transport system permease subunit
MSDKLIVSPKLIGLMVFFLALVVGLAVVGKVPLRYNVRNLVVRWRITLLTALAFTLVVGLMTVMLAFVNGMYALTSNSGKPENVLVLADGATDELFSNLGFGQDIKKIELSRQVARGEDGKRLVSWETYIVANQPIPTRKCPHCGALVGVEELDGRLAEHGEPTCRGSGEVVHGRQRRFIQVRAIMDPVVSGLVHDLEVYPGGEWFNADSGVQPLPGSTKGEQAIQGVIGEGLARELGPDQGKKALEIGDLFDLGGRKWVVVGILRSSGSTFDSEVWAKHSVVSKMFGKEAFTTVVIRTPDAVSARELADDLTTNFKDPAVQAQTEPEYFEKLSTTNKQFLYAILIVVVIMAIGGVFGIMNTMFAAIAQRTKDIGVLRILGFARWQVLVSFFLESLVLAAVGGALGCAVGMLSHGWSTTSIVSGGPGSGKSIVLKLVVDGNILLAGMLFSLAMGCLGGLLPALSAMRLKPLESVR